MARVDSLLNRTTFRVNWEVAEVAGEGQDLTGGNFRYAECKSYEEALTLAKAIVDAKIDDTVSITVQDIESADYTLRLGTVVLAVVTQD